MGAGAGVSKRGYHAKVIDHYENPRNVSPLLFVGKYCAFPRVFHWLNEEVVI